MGLVYVRDTVRSGCMDEFMSRGFAEKHTQRKSELLTADRFLLKTFQHIDTLDKRVVITNLYNLSAYQYKVVVFFHCVEMTIISRMSCIYRNNVLLSNDKQEQQAVLSDNQLSKQLQKRTYLHLNSNNVRA